DRRVTFAQITEKGISLLNDIFPDHAAEIDEMISVLSEEEVEMCTDMLKRVGLNAKQFHNK
ncbi:MarR family transcriptional regulator MhqR, partial [Bacillus spizizenii]|nr:MarR family transcriptional regulator MhqR [Bacillus spizizenii]